MKQIVSLIALLLLNITAYSYQVTIKNGTPYSAIVTITYSAATDLSCRPDMRLIRSGEDEVFNAQLCSVNSVNATILIPEGKQPEIGVMVAKEIPMESFYNTLYTGSATWIIAGPIDNKYVVTRRVQ